MPNSWPRLPSDPISEMLLPRFYGSVATLFGSPRAKAAGEVRGADLAFLGVPWSAPVPDSRMGAAGAGYVGTNLTPQMFRTNSLKYGGYLPEFNVDVFEHYSLVDCGDSEVVHDIRQTFADVVRRVGEIIEAGAIPLTIGGNSGPSSYSVLEAVAAHAGGPVAVLNLDAHHDNMLGEWSDDTEEQPRWGATWARRILDLPGVDPTRYFHVGLRGPRNDRGVFDRFLEKGVKREHIYTFGHLMAARRKGFETWAAKLAAEIADGAAKVWIGMDPDVLDMSASPEFGDEPLGIRAEEACWLAYEIGKAVGRERLGGISFMAVPYSAMTIHWICIYVMLYTLAGTLGATMPE